MNKADNPNRWFHPWRAPTPAGEIDAADMGTAFGLEVSLDQPPVAETVATVPARRTPGWVARWASRGRRSSD